ncbi:hypothetical protein [Wenjunlia vitaminophila]|uniref:hypothetical protein n=1 Tax=Wenjunlia vitaminophila TaxID=76728 RepID=UPI0003A174AF|nr:hypothetical protein [Wenjunlia vitaminophila]
MLKGRRRLRATISQLEQDLEDARRAAQRARAEVDALRQDLAEARALIGTLRSSDDEEDDYERLLRSAAGVAVAEIVCHRDTWAFLVERTATNEHFRLPADIDERPDGTVTVRISGRSLTAAVEALREARRAAPSPAPTRHLAAQVFDRIRDALEEVGPDNDDRLIGGAREDRSAARIVIDDRLT